MECKRRKLNNDNFNNFDEKVSVEPVLSNEITNNNLVRLEVYISDIINKAKTSAIIKTLNAKCPIKELMHLKRVKDNSIILCLANELDENQVLENLKKNNFDVSLIENIRKNVVYSSKPITRKHFDIINKNWPCNFREDKYLETLLSGNRFNNDELKSHANWMLFAVEAAKKSNIKNGVAIIDPLNNRLLCYASDDRTEHPLKHAVMIGIDLVSRGQGGGVWNVADSDYFIVNNTIDKYAKDGGPYLCTGFDVYVIREPCVMCAMALIHSRVNRVFYAVPSEHGSLGSKLKIHTIKSLNHNFEVYKGLLKDFICSNIL